MTEQWPPVVTQTEGPASPEPTPEPAAEEPASSPAARKLEEAKGALAAFLGEHRFSREDAQTFAEAWLFDARRVSEIELGPIFRGGGQLHPAHLAQAVQAFVIRSPEFEAWVLGQLDESSLLPQKKREAQMKRLQTAVSKAETAITRAELEAKREEAEAKLAELEQGEA